MKYTKKIIVVAIAIGIITMFAVSIFSETSEAGGGDEHRNDNTNEHSYGDGEPPEEGHSRAEDRSRMEDR